VLGKTQALAELGGHSHWVWKARYNPQHDQLLASCSSDGLVALWYTPVLARSAEYADAASKPSSSPSATLRWALAGAGAALAGAGAVRAAAAHVAPLSGGALCLCALACSSHPPPCPRPFPKHKLPGAKGAAAAAAAARRNEADGRVHAYDEHEDSTYCVAWSASDPWAFASLSYDGRLVVNKVPKNVKYKVLI
jgi:WD40 repeat protein